MNPSYLLDDDKLVGCASRTGIRTADPETVRKAHPTFHINKKGPRFPEWFGFLNWIRIFCGGLFLLICVFTQVHAADLVADVKSRLISAPLIRGQFEQQKTVAGFKKPLVSSGDFLLAKSHGVLWRTQKPFASTLVIGRDKLTARQGDGSVGYQLDTQHEPALRVVNALMFALLSGDVAMLQQRFRVEGQLVGHTAWKLQLTPIDPNIAHIFKRISIEGDSYVRLVKLEESNGDSTLLNFDKMTQSPALSAEEGKNLDQ